MRTRLVRRDWVRRAGDHGRRARLLPTLRGYDRSWIRDDVIAGVAAGTVVIPQAMAYATIAGLPVEIGLYTCMVPMVVYALLGGSRSLSISTTSTIAVLTASALSRFRPTGRPTRCCATRSRSPSWSGCSCC